MSDDGRYVYEIARDLGMAAKAFRAEVESWGLGWDVSHHMRRLDAAQCAEVTRRLVGTSTEAPRSQARRRAPAKVAGVGTRAAEGLAEAPESTDADAAEDAAQDAAAAEDAEALEPEDRPVADDDAEGAPWADRGQSSEGVSRVERLEAAVAEARRKARKAEAKAKKALASAAKARALATDFLLRNKRKKAADATRTARKFKKKAKKRLVKAQVWAQRALEAAARLTDRGGDQA
jgi:hypothetical protein